MGPTERERVRFACSAKREPQPKLAKFKFLGRGGDRVEAEGG